jgi:hypothetical protein
VVEGKEILATKWDSFCKHASWKKVGRNIGTNVKKGDWYHFKDCGHAKNHKLLAFHSHGNVGTQLTNKMTKDNWKTVVQFAIVLNLL